MTNNSDDTSSEFSLWAHNFVDNHAPMVSKKAEEYGTFSLSEVGRLFALGQGRSVSSVEAIELGCLLYAHGKIQRSISAVLRGRLPTEDTVVDTAIYSLMALFVKEFHRWP